ncbi:MAG: TetR/AcrR family transcriptional regulator [Gammaproteobacteria bacterium]|nr:TetR/AcrR family transcriptional regulator [Gammaproteobacteria bacterium]
MSPKSVAKKKKPSVASKSELRRTKDADATRRNIIVEALREFSEYGLSGARVDRIANKTHTSKRMMYYYFESKEGLYLEVLKESYRQLRELEANFHLEDLPPMLALRKLVEGTVDYHASHSDFIRVIMTENIHKGNHISQLPELKDVNRKAIEIIADICQRGTAEGIFRSDLEPVKLHENISALAFFNVSNRYTFGFLFDQDFTDPRTHAARRAQIVDTITRYVRAA